MGIDEKVYDYSQTLLENLKERFAKIDETAEYNQMKVVAAMQKNHVAEMHLNGTTGYGYDDLGRDKLDEIYAQLFGTEAAWCASSSSTAPTPSPAPVWALKTGGRAGVRRGAPTTPCWGPSAWWTRATAP